MSTITGARTSTPTTTSSPPSQLEWQPVDGVQSAVWVGRFRGRFVGMIEARWREGFAVTTRLGKSLGMFPTIEAAQHAFDDVLRAQH